ncbi:ABC transporter permease [Microbacterium sp. SORGH_AS_0888]|uniref:ABC transporter permease n=1 Tax=Microbacterium sp. SORGH_AS_0888 TaxID=3041791 RepID=UPI002788DA4A|nr:ABC transporter permease [Microbacterium sp. SORGH_AS_0888]MDQ1129295.1 putative spermidine/putrescine transport system permease protein [Microbacterium sp. SORGH_AS_0888]
MSSSTIATGARMAPVAQRRTLGVSRAELRWLMWPPLLFFVVALGLPMVALVMQSLEGGGAAYPGMFSVPAFLGSLGRTLLMALVTMVLTSILGAVYGLALVASPAWLRIVLLAALMLSLWTSVMVRSFGWMLMELPKGAIYWFLGLFGLADEPLEIYQTTFGMYPAMIAVMLPFAVLPIMSALQSIDQEQLKAASVFGAGPLLTFRTVTWPQMLPSIISGAVLVFVMALGFYVTPLLLGGPSNMTISGVINSQLKTANRPDLGAAMSILLVGATILIYLIADRLFRVSEKWG